MPARVLVLGAGVSGLSTAHELLAAGCEVTLWAREEPLATTSAVAAALWFPFEAGPPARVAGWATRSYARFLRLAHARTPGISLISFVDLRSPAENEPAWAVGLEERAPLAPAERAGFAQGWRMKVPVIETPTYLPWLFAELGARGARFEARTVRSLDETRGFDALVNCTGLGARELVGDRACFAIRGQVVRVPRGAVTSALNFHRADGAFGYVIPRADDCVLGGTAERGNESLEVDARASQAILERCRALEPRIEARILGARVGLRPGRAEIRLERERLADGRALVHDYGHGGCGVTLSWACAEDAAALVTEALH